MTTCSSSARGSLALGRGGRPARIHSKFKASSQASLRRTKFNGALTDETTDGCGGGGGCRGGPGRIGRRLCLFLLRTSQRAFLTGWDQINSIGGGPAGRD